MAETLYLTATSLSELLGGIEMLPGGKRKDGLEAALGGLLDVLFGSSILPFDRSAAITYATPCLPSAHGRSPDISS